jgi:hypothetical protein
MSLVISHHQIFFISLAISFSSCEKVIASSVFISKFENKSHQYLTDSLGFLKKFTTGFLTTSYHV